MLDATAKDSDPLVPRQQYKDSYCCFFPNKPSVAVASLVPLAGGIALTVVASQTSSSTADFALRMCSILGAAFCFSVTAVGAYVVGCT